VGWREQERAGGGGDEDMTRHELIEVEWKEAYER
jgi:hypothetical protein